MLVAQSCPTLCNPIDCSPPGSSVHGIHQARILEWVSSSPGNLPDPGIEPRSPALQADSLPFEPPGKLKNTGVGSLSLLQGNFPTQELNRGLLQFRQILYQLSCQRSKNTGTKSLQSCLTLATPWTVARQTPLSIGFSRQEHWSGLLVPSPGDLPDPEIEPASPVPPALAGRFFNL